MARGIVFGDALVITSEVTLKDWELVKKYRPEAIVLRDEEKNEYFRIGVGSGDVSQFGVEWGGETHDERKLATITLAIDGCGTPEEIKKDLAEDIGVILLNINKVEEKIPEVLDEIKAERDKILEAITIQ